MPEQKIIDNISSPSCLKELERENIPQLCQELRELITSTVNKNGGHLAANLGTVELAVSLVRTLNLPRDRVIWDVGHQSYAYKILTDRKDRFSTIRTPGGISGFEKMSESEYDAFGTGHSSTAISAALGLAQADRIAGRQSTTVAVVGDGAFTGGLVHEALNNIDENLKLIIILNENEMSISKNIGGFARTIAKIRATRGYYNTKSATRKAVSAIPLIGAPLFKAFRKAKQKIKNSMYKSTYFEDLGLYYLGPANGNDFEQVEALLKEALSYGKATVIHLKTKKGKGYAPAEENPGKYHSVRPEGAVKTVNFSEQMGRLLTEKAYENHKICAITAAMTDGCGLLPFKEKHPDRFFDVGIAEAHELVFAAGLSAGGMHPFACVYSTFLQRAYDSIIHDIALQNLPLTVMVDRASLALSDGATHHGIFDVSFLSAVPGIEIYAPSDFGALNDAMDLSLTSGKPTFIRYPDSDEFSHPELLEKKHSHLRTNIINEEKYDLYIITYGKIVTEAVKAREALIKYGVNAGIILLEKLKPFDTDDILSLLSSPAPIIFLEEGVLPGGAGENLYEKTRSSAKMAGRAYKILAIDNSFADCRDNIPIYEFAGISAKDIITTAQKLLSKGDN